MAGLTTIGRGLVGFIRALVGDLVVGSLAGVEVLGGAVRLEVGEVCCQFCLPNKYGAKMLVHKIEKHRGFLK